MRRQVGTFRALDPAGREVVVGHFRTFSRGPTGLVETGDSFETERGQPVNRVAKGVYQTVGYPLMRLTSDEPEAP